jgi:hypothetical protein
MDKRRVNKKLFGLPYQSAALVCPIIYAALVNR